ncbi:hypothetical protein [Streptomyces sp. NPDC046870]
MNHPRGDLPSVGGGWHDVYDVADLDADQVRLSVRDRRSGRSVSAG